MPLTRSLDALSSLYGRREADLKGPPGSAESVPAAVTIALTRQRCHQPTRAYTERRTSEGKTSREIKRCLKRYIARDLYRLLEARPQPLDET